MAHTRSIQNSCETEKPSSAAAVIATLTAVTFPAPKRRVRRSDARLDRIVPLAMTTVMKPA